jgi:hypothetical protein
MLTIGNVTTSDTYASCEACAFGCMDAAASNYDANAQLEMVLVYMQLHLV